MSHINYSLLSEVIFANDEAFSDVDFEKAKMLLYVCKNARNNKHIQMTMEKAKVRNYCNQITELSSMKTNDEFYNRSIREFDGASDLNIDDTYKERVRIIIGGLLKESQYVIDGVKDIMSVEQIRHIDMYYIQLRNAVATINRLGIDIDNIREEDMELCEEDEEYYSIKYNRIELATIYKYNSFLLNLLEHLGKEDEIIEYISSKQYDNVWWKLSTPTIHPI